MSLSAILSQSFQRHPNRTALCCGDQTWTYSELDRCTASLAAGLSACGIWKGERIAFFLPNGPELVLLNLACIRLGAIAVPLNIRLTGPELAYNLNHCGARICVADQSFFEALDPVRNELPWVERFFMAGSGKRPPGTEAFQGLFAEMPDRANWEACSPGAPAAILYTSGTTARPKGVTHTQNSLARTVCHYRESVGLEPADVVLGMLSLAHVFGFTLQLLSPLAAGATVVIAPSLYAQGMPDLIARHRVSHLYGLPAVFDSLLQAAETHCTDWTGLRYCLAGGDAVPTELSERMRRILGTELYQGCGMTEVIPYCLNRPGLENRAGTIGPPSIGMQVRLADAGGNEVEEGETGEIQVRSDALMAGYWNDPEASRQAMVDGWFLTGDLGQRDDAGYYRFVGRSKEIIVRAGSNIAPLEVEIVLAQHPAVREAAVVGKCDSVLGETVAAFVVLHRALNLDTEELLRFAACRLAAYKLPESIYFVEDLPRGSTGKVDRKALKGWLDGAAREESEGAGQLPLPQSRIGAMHLVAGCL